MVAVRPYAALAGILSSVWGLYIGLFVSVPGSLEMTLIAGLLLLVSLLIGFVDLRVAFYFSAVIAAVLVAKVYLSGVSDLVLVIAAVLCASTVVLDIMAARHRAVVSEENHPLNLPVFG